MKEKHKKEKKKKEIIDEGKETKEKCDKEEI